MIVAVFAGSNKACALTSEVNNMVEFEFPDVNRAHGAPPSIFVRPEETAGVTAQEGAVDPPALTIAASPATEGYGLVKSMVLIAL
jgi:hypothetical protein